MSSTSHQPLHLTGGMNPQSKGVIDHIHRADGIERILAVSRFFVEDVEYTFRRAPLPKCQQVRAALLQAMHRLDALILQKLGDSDADA